MMHFPFQIDASLMHISCKMRKIQEMECDIYMKRLLFKNGLFATIMLAVLLTGCSNDVQTENTTMPDMSAPSEEETQTTNEQTEEQSRLQKKTSSM